MELQGHKNILSSVGFSSPARASCLNIVENAPAQTNISHSVWKRTYDCKQDPSEKEQKDQSVFVTWWSLDWHPFFLLVYMDKQYLPISWTDQQSTQHMRGNYFSPSIQTLLCTLSNYLLKAAWNVSDSGWLSWYWNQMSGSWGHQCLPTSSAYPADFQCKYLDESLFTFKKRFAPTTDYRS